ncbi:PfkB family carbohydrate kinase [Antribacter sp. KLBMP9083]|uniref:PfkB family carbohydrate kinase n=1 Tax=Antribacter soli TaxID=2910976 RepID=A0AA41UCU0_9MICO|nr:PfkB family carbohydrate kinase [Antribacter soli]
MRQDVSAGGPAANAAVTAAALGVRAVLVSVIGTGPVGSVARRDLERYSVEVHDVAPRDDTLLAVSAVLVDDVTGDRSVVSPDATLAPSDAVPTPDALGALPRPDIVLLDGHHPAIARAVLAFVHELEPRPQVVLDAGRWRPVFAELLPAADVAACSADFALPPDAGVTLPDGGARADMAAPHAVDAAPPGPRALVVTHGPDPVEWAEADGRRGTVDVPQVAARDTLGAGDAFHGALVVALARGDDLPDACAFAARVASTRVAHVGPREWLAEIGTVSP